MFYAIDDLEQFLLICCIGAIFGRRERFSQFLDYLFRRSVCPGGKHGECEHIRSYTSMLVLPQLARNMRN